METWYKYSSSAWRNEPHIVPVQVEKSSASSVWISGRPVRLQSTYDNYFRTFDEAKQYVVNKYTKRVEQLKEQLLRAEGTLKEVQEQTI